MTALSLGAAAVVVGVKHVQCEEGFARKCLDASWAGTDSYGIIPEEEEDDICDTGGHWAYGEMSYDGVAALFAHIGIREDSVFCDFGSGLGKMVAQGLLTTDAKKVMGVEMSLTRHTQAKHASLRLSKILNMIGGDAPSVTWMEEENACLTPSFVLRAGDRELRLMHGDCLKVPIGDITDVYMANLTWPNEAVNQIGQMLDKQQNIRKVATLKKLDESKLRSLKLESMIYVSMSWQDENRQSYGVPIYVYSK